MAGRWEVFCGGAAHTEMAKCASSAEALPNASGKVLSEAKPCSAHVPCGGRHGRGSAAECARARREVGPHVGCVCVRAGVCVRV